MSLRLGFKVSVINHDGGNIIHHELAVFSSTADVKPWMNYDLLYWQNNVVLLFSVGGGVPLPADNFRLSPRHLHSRGIGATVLRVSTETGAHVGTAAVGNQSALLGLADVNTVGTRHQDCGTRGSGEQGDSTQIRGLLADNSQGADPGVAVSGVLQWGNCSNCHSIHFICSWCWSCGSGGSRSSPCGSSGSGRSG